jgi:hypothetical protein
MTVFILLAEYSYGSGWGQSVLAVKDSEEACLDIASRIDPNEDGWDGFCIQEWNTEIGKVHEREV